MFEFNFLTLAFTISKWTQTVVIFTEIIPMLSEYYERYYSYIRIENIVAMADLILHTSPH